MNNKGADYLKELNENQLEAVLHKDGPLMVIAGAGSGKTRVLTYRIAYLMQQGIDAFSILALTFTNKASREMKARIAELVGEGEAKNLWMGTFHSVFARILRQEADKLGFPRDFTIYDTQDSNRLISSIIKELGLDKDIYKYKQIRNRISSFKNSLITVKAYHDDIELQEADSLSRRPKLGEIYKEYVERCFKAGAMDFDDLLLKTNELLNMHPQVLAKYQDRFRYILVDEYQDTNHSQYLIVRALSDKFQNICVVGDDAQSIYGFRGANINNILNFQKDYHGVKLYRLEQNYRSTKNILETASSLISNNNSRVGKKLWSSGNNGELVKLNCYSNGRDEAEGVSDIIEKKIKEKYSLNNVSILVRAIYQTREFEERFLKIGLGYRVLGGIRFYERAEIKDAISYLRIINQKFDDLALERVIGAPKKGIGDATIKKIYEFGAKKKLCLEDSIVSLIELDQFKPKVKKTFSVLIKMIEKWRTEAKTIKHYDLIKIILDESGYSSILKNKKDLENENRLENLKELIRAMQDYDNLQSFLEHVSLATSADQEWEGEKVNLMTMHAAKGLEFDVVFLPGWEEGLFPHQKSLQEKGDFAL
ncbi:MAG: ATP-dependent DNA helicase, partial [Flavobacteriaceae bacterium]|nr:ATP-dependent DNA helicase [Flavobacteriaceae bacterium]